MAATVPVGVPPGAVTFTAMVDVAVSAGIELGVAVAVTVASTLVGAFTITGTVTLVPVVVPVIVTLWMPPWSTDGTRNDTVALPASSLLFPSPDALTVLSTGNSPTRRLPNITLSVLSLTSPAPVMASEVRLTVTISPTAYSPVPPMTPTARWAKSTSSGSESSANSAMKSTMVCRSILPLSRLLVASENAKKLSPVPEARNEFAATL